MNVSDDYQSKLQSPVEGEFESIFDIARKI
jgi:hypothetical protein